MALHDSSTPARPLFQHMWTLSSTKHLRTIELNVPGAVFVTYDAALDIQTGTGDSSVLCHDCRQSTQEHASVSASSTPATTNGGSSGEPEESGGAPSAAMRDVARVVVTTDSEELLDQLELVAFSLGGSSDGVCFRAKNCEAELRGAMLTQVVVNEQHSVREVKCAAASCVVESGVIVQHDLDAEVCLTAENSGKLFVAANDGLSAQALWCTAHGPDGVLQLQLPSIHVQDNLSLWTGWDGGAIAVKADSVATERTNVTAVRGGNVVLEAARFKADDLTALVGPSGTVRIIGDGHVREQTSFAIASSSATSPGVTALKTRATTGLASSVLLGDVKTLRVCSAVDQAVAYAATEPETIEVESWLWWRDNDRPSPSRIVVPTTPEALARATTPHPFRDLPLCEPMAFRVRVKEGETDWKPELHVLRDDDSLAYWKSRALDYTHTGAGVAVVGAVTALVLRRRRRQRVQLAKQASAA